MRIALNLDNLRGFGSASVGRNVLRALARSETEHEFLAWVPSEWKLSPDAYGPRFELRAVQPGMVRKMVTENFSMRWGLRRWKAERIFTLGDTGMPCCRLPHLLLVQQPYLARGPENWGFTAPASFRLRLRLLETYFRATLASVTMLTVQTRDMKTNLAARWKIPEEKIAVVPSAVDPLLYGNEAAIEERAAHANPNGPRYLFYPASGGPHKNHAVLAGMMAALRAAHPELSCKLTVGQASVPALAEAARRLGVLDRFDFLGATPAKEVARLLHGAAAMVMPSKLESFGIPYYEALASGCPVIAAERPFAREACAEAALYAPPDSGDAFAACAARILDSADFARERAEAARERFVKIRWSWTDIVKAYLRLLEAS